MDRPFPLLLRRRTMMTLFQTEQQVDDVVATALLELKRGPTRRGSSTSPLDSSSSMSSSSVSVQSHGTTDTSYPSFYLLSTSRHVHVDNDVVGDDVIVAASTLPTPKEQPRRFSSLSLLPPSIRAAIISASHSSDDNHLSDEYTTNFRHNENKRLILQQQQRLKASFPAPPYYLQTTNNNFRDCRKATGITTPRWSSNNSSNNDAYYEPQSLGERSTFVQLPSESFQNHPTQQIQQHARMTAGHSSFNSATTWRNYDDESYCYYYDNGSNENSNTINCNKNSINLVSLGHQNCESKIGGGAPPSEMYEEHRKRNLVEGISSFDHQMMICRHSRTRRDHQQRKQLQQLQQASIKSVPKAKTTSRNATNISTHYLDTFPINTKHPTKSRLPNLTRDYLLNWIDTHLDHPYPSEKEKDTMMNYTGLDRKRLDTWLRNNRNRYVKLKKKKQQQQLY